MQPDLSVLKDVHIPEQINTFWPIAPGWWILLGIAIISPLTVYIIRYFRIRTAKYYALSQLDMLVASADEDAAHFAEEVSKLLRRIAILKYGKDKVSSLAEMKWVQFLNKDGYFSLNPKLANLFAYAPYAKGKVSDSDSVIALKQIAINWINKNT